MFINNDMLKICLDGTLQHHSKSMDGYVDARAGGNASS